MLGVAAWAVVVAVAEEEAPGEVAVVAVAVVVVVAFVVVEASPSSSCWVVAGAFLSALYSSLQVLEAVPCSSDGMPATSHLLTTTAQPKCQSGSHAYWGCLAARRVPRLRLLRHLPHLPHLPTCKAGRGLAR